VTGVTQIGKNGFYDVNWYCNELEVVFDDGGQFL
jgi:hypothetical protein